MVTFNPVSGATHVTSGQTTFQIIVDFSQILDPNSVTISSFLFRLSGTSTNLSGTAFRDSTDTSRAIFTPSSGIFATLSPATSAAYTAILLGSGNAVGVRSIEGFFATTVSGAFITATVAMGGDTTPPIVSGVTPASGSTGFAVSGNPTVKFNESMTSGSISGQIKIRVSGAGSDVAAALSLASDKVTVTIDPTAFLSGNTIYRGFVHNTVTDLAGNALAASYTWSFTTINPTAPTVSGTTPTNGATAYEVSGTPVVVFSTPIQSGTVSGQIKLRISGVGSDVAATIAVSSNLTTVKITPTANLGFCTVYNGFIHNTVKEQLGVTPMAASYTWSFSTFCPTAPVVSGVTPVSGATGVDLTTRPLIIFSTAMQSGSFSGQICVCRSGTSVSESFTLNISSNLLAVEVVPTANLAYLMPYDLIINNTVKEQLGATSMAASYSTSFTTVAPAFTAIYNVTQTGTDSRSLDENTFRAGTRVQGGSTLIGHVVKKVTLRMRTGGTPLSGIAYIVLRDSSGSTIQTTYGMFNPSTDITASYTDYSYTNLSANYAFAKNDKILVEWISGNGTDLIRVATNTTNPFTGAIGNTYEGVTYSGASFTDNAGEDLAGIFYEV